MLECVINVSEGRRLDVVSAIGEAAGRLLLDVHTDPDHHRAVLTIGGPAAAVEAAARAVAGAAVAQLDLREHHGAHPRFGVVDVVPFADLAAPTDVTAVALGARDRFAAWAGDELGLPCFLYGPHRSLPDVRRQAWRGLAPDTGPPRPHPTAGAAAVGARPVLVAYNLWLDHATVATARAVAAAIRGPAVRALGLDVGGQAQVSCNLIAPLSTGPAEVRDAVAARAAVHRAELVGLMPAAVLEAVPAQRWAELDLDPAKTVESRLRAAGLDRGK